MPFRSHEQRYNLTELLLRTALAAIDAFRAHDSHAPVQLLAGFLAIALHNRETGEWPRIEDLRESLRTTQQSASRVAAALGDGPRGKPGGPGRRPGLGLICKVPDMRDRRAVRLELTKAGGALIERILEIAA